MAVGSFYWIQPNEMFAIGGTVTGGAATSYLDEWLVDGRPGRPVLYTSGSPTWTITGSAKTVGFVAVCGHNIDAARNIVFGGDISKTIVGPALPADGVPLNPWGTFTPVSCSSATLAIASNTVSVRIAEAVIGKYRTLERQLAVAPEFMPSPRKVIGHDAIFNSLMPYDTGVSDGRTLKGSVILSDSGLADVNSWWLSTKGNSLPSVIVPDSNVQDAWLCAFTAFSWKPGKYNQNSVTLEFKEYPRGGW